MVAIRGTAGRAVLGFAQQTSLSVLGTLAATVVLANLRSEWPLARAPAERAAVREPALPSLTSGGKFAARALVEGDPEPFVTLTTLPLVLPLFTASSVPPLDAATDFPLLLADAPASEPAKPVRTASHRDARHPATAAASAERRGQSGPVVMAALPDLPDAAVDDGSLLARSKSAYRTVTLWGDTLLDHLLP